MSPYRATTASFVLPLTVGLCDRSFDSLQIIDERSETICTQGYTQSSPLHLSRPFVRGMPSIWNWRLYCQTQARQQRAPSMPLSTLWTLRQSLHVGKPGEALDTVSRVPRSIWRSYSASVRPSRQAWASLPRVSSGPSTVTLGFLVGLSGRRSRNA